MSIAGKTANDMTIGTITLSDGSVHTHPVVLLSPEDAALVGEYQSWLSRARLDRKLWCRECGLQQEVQIAIKPHQIGFVCDHRMLFYQGPVPVVETNHPHAGESLIAPYRVVIPDTPITPSDAFMLRRWDTLCRAYGFREALWCLTCEDEGNASGIRPDVGPTHYALLCRCQRRIHTGLAV